MRLHLKSYLLILTSFAASLCINSAAYAQSQSLDIRPYGERIMGDELTVHFQGQVHDGAYNFSRSGEARAFYTEQHNKDGTVLYTEGELIADGRWGVFGDILCYYYVNNALNGGCFRVYRVKNCYF